ncbi:hypothetical protein L2D14_01265 [Thalassospiraceae bacterium LMO-JJ14]|nr:hypothetical protein L2D14_01265 [Thalassospiraceae bacterium LMO-JJ14]
MRTLCPADIPLISALPKATLEEMRAAGRRVLASEHELTEAGSNVVSEILRPTKSFYEWDHYPDGDVYCTNSHAQYYYHAHPPTERGNAWGDEHGHFHTFLRPYGFPENIEGTSGDDAPAHLVAVSMDYNARATRLFTTNRWVTGEAWFDASVVCQLLPHFHIGHDAPSETVNEWISHLLVLYRPTIEALLHARDDILKSHQPSDAGTHVHDDRSLEVVSIVDIDVRSQLDAVEAALA